MKVITEINYKRNWTETGLQMGATTELNVILELHKQTSI